MVVKVTSVTKAFEALLLTYLWQSTLFHFNVFPVVVVRDVFFYETHEAFFVRSKNNYFPFFHRISWSCNTRRVNIMAMHSLRLYLSSFIQTWSLEQGFMRFYLWNEMCRVFFLLLNFQKDTLLHINCCQRLEMSYLY